MIKIAILGGSGMLGHILSLYFNNRMFYETYTSYRNDSNWQDIFDKGFDFDVLKHDVSIIPDVDYVINCIGTIPQKNVTNKDHSIVNLAFPHLLAHECGKRNIKLIHVSTDCVYSGMRDEISLTRSGNYSEHHYHNATDFYGISKSLGEPKNCMNLRTSLIGEEINSSCSFLEWVRSRKNKQLLGYTNHFWNGITTLEFAKICDTIIQENLYNKTTYHLISGKKISKYELIKLIDKKYNLNCDIIPAKTKIGIDRSLGSVNGLNRKLRIPTIQEQIDEL